MSNSDKASTQFNKINKLNKFSSSKNIRFKHSNYGIIKSGVYKGLEVEIRNYMPEKLEVKMGDSGKMILTTRSNLIGKKYEIINIVPSRVSGILNDFREVVLNADNIFYRDVLLKKMNDNINNYASVKKIIQKGLNNDYYFRGEIFKDKKYVDIDFRFSDILEFMNNFRINTPDEKESDILDEKEYIYEGDNSNIETDETRSENGSEIDYSDIVSERDSELDSDSDMMDTDDKPSVLYKERTGVLSKKISLNDNIILKHIEHILLSIRYRGRIKSKYFSKKEDRIDEINNMNMLPNVLDVLDEINKITKHVNNLLKVTKKSITVNSIDHMFLISGIVFMNTSSVNFNRYMEYLIESKYFGKNINANLKTCIILKNSKIFGCEIMTSGLDIDKILKNIQSCFIRIIETKLDIKSKSLSELLKESDEEESGEESYNNNSRDIDFIKLKTSEKRDDINQPSNDVFVKGISTKRTESIIKDQLISRKENTKNKNKIILYDYLIENIDKIEDEIERLRPSIISILTSVFKEFNEQYELCNDKLCNEDIISKYIKKTFDKIQESNGSIVGMTQNDNITLQKYTELKKLRIIKNREKLNILKEAPDYKKGELDSYAKQRVKRFRDIIKKAKSKSKSQSKSSKSDTQSGTRGINEQMNKMDIDNTKMITYLLKDVNLDKI